MLMRIVVSNFRLRFLSMARPPPLNAQERHFTSAIIATLLTLYSKQLLSLTGWIHDFMQGIDLRTTIFDDYNVPPQHNFVTIVILSQVAR